MYCDITYHNTTCEIIYILYRLLALRQREEHKRENIKEEKVRRLLPIVEKRGDTGLSEGSSIAGGEIPQVWDIFKYIFFVGYKRIKGEENK